MTFPDGLYDLAFLTHDFDERITDLADMAENEDWDYRAAASARTNPILKNYILYTYKRLASLERIEVSTDGQWLTFNTGLVTESQEDIFALFSANRIPNKQPWHFTAWVKRSDNRLTGFPTLPDIATYYEDPKSLVFDFSKEFRPNIDHIIQDNKERFPPPFNTMEDFLLTNLLSGAISHVISRIRRNYKTAIPQYFNGKMQILLPLCLSNPKIADLAIAIEDRGGYYRASTCLTLDMAYNNARLLARPDRDWLQP